MRLFDVRLRVTYTEHYATAIEADTVEQARARAMEQDNHRDGINGAEHVETEVEEVMDGTSGEALWNDLDGDDEAPALNPSVSAQPGELLPVDGTPLTIRKDTVVVTILRPADIPLPDTLDEIVEFIDSGEGIGSFTLSASTDVPANRVREALRAVGNDGSFFEE